MGMILIIMMTSFVSLVKANVSIQQKLQWIFKFRLKALGNATTQTLKF
jgi:hypothetical protein